MKELITKLESAKEDQQYSLIREAVALVHTHARCGLLIRAIDFAEEHHLPELLLGVVLTLVPEGYTWEVSSPMFLSDLERKPSAKVWPPSMCGGPKPYGVTPALALTIASLKAHVRAEATK